MVLVVALLAFLGLNQPQLRRVVRTAPSLLKTA